MISFAPLLYRDIWADRGGPISGVESTALSVFDRKAYQATAFLRPGLFQNGMDHQQRGAADGIGSGENPAEAQNVAISEALERWAFREARKSPDRSKYGFDHDRSSVGMAAHPGFKWQARRRARLEALERFALVGWWDRKLESTLHRPPYPGVGMVRIQHQQGRGEVVVLFHKAPTGFVAYGHAAGSTLTSATSRAALRLVRNEFLISRRRACGAMAQPADAFEKRCLHYASEEGHAEFLTRVNQGPAKQPLKWNTIYDGEVSGPWSKWTTVWRHCVEMPSYDFLDTRKLYFFW